MKIISYYNRLLIIVFLLFANYVFFSKNNTYEYFDENLPTLKYLEMENSKKKTYETIFKKFKDESSLKNIVNVVYEKKSQKELTDEEKNYVDLKPKNKVQDWSSLLLLDTNGKLIKKYTGSPYILKKLEGFITKNIN